MTITPNEYAARALKTEADQSLILERLYTDPYYGKRAMRLDNAARGLSDDAGEISSAVKKYIEYGQPLDKINLLEEVGDCLWRLAQICKACDFTLEQAMEANLAKLEKARYKNGYNDVDAAEKYRDRDAERKAMEESLQEPKPEPNFDPAPLYPTCPQCGKQFFAWDYAICKSCRNANARDVNRIVGKVGGQSPAADAILEKADRIEVKEKPAPGPLPDGTHRSGYVQTGNDWAEPSEHPLPYLDAPKARAERTDPPKNSPGSKYLYPPQPR